MTASDTLDHLRAQFPACDLIAYADLSVDMVLATSTDDTVTQERWEALCAMARDALRGGQSSDILACLGAQAPHVLARATLINDAECHVVLTARAEPDFAFCAVGDVDFEAASFIAAAQPVLDQLVADV